MSTSDAIDKLVDRLVADILDLVQKARVERRTEALSAVRSMIGGLRGRAEPAAARSTPARSKPAERARTAPVARPAKKAKVAAPPPARHRRGPKVHVVPAATPAYTARATATPARGHAAVRARLHRTPEPIEEPTSEPISQRSDPQTTLAREATVFDAVRTLVRVTAGEIARHTGLPNGTVYVLLRSLVSAGRVAKTDTARGVEYSLVSSGGILPFKRARAGATTRESTPPGAPPADPASAGPASAASASEASSANGQDARVEGAAPALQ